MCGIVGYAGFTKRKSLEKSIFAIKHRGPDSNGTAYFEGVALGNTRLAIIDLSNRGRQPIFNRDKSLCITYNGEIYNFHEVKKKLEKKYTFKSHTDTEAILYAYAEWGEKCLNHLQGMFSFVIYDLKNKTIFGARDRLGQKPLKYFFDGKKFIFASEIKAIIPLLDEKPRMDELAIDNFLTLQYVPSPKTGFKNIHKLPAAHYFVFKNNKLQVKRYWSLDFRTKLSLSVSEWEELVYKELEKAVASHLLSDVPVGALLSGGLDSSLIVAFMAKNSSQRIQTFSIGFDDKKFDESTYSSEVSQMYDTKHTQLDVSSSDLIKNLKRIVDVYDEPIADNSILPTLIVSKLAGSKVKVALTGDGGDENFAGYDRYSIVKLADSISHAFSPIKGIMSLSSQASFKLYPSKLTERMLRFFSTIDQSFYRKYIQYNSFFIHDVKHSLYSTDFKKQVLKNDTFEIYKSLYDDSLSSIDNSLNIDINTYLPDDLLYKSDSASMAYGLELRAPFLDHVFMEKMAQMPDGLKISYYHKKKLLKNIAYKYKLLPKNVIYRKKQGFNIPQNKWFKGDLKNYVYETILSSAMVRYVFNKAKVEEYLDIYYSSRLNYDNNIFALLVLSLWMDTYLNYE